MDWNIILCFVFANVIPSQGAGLRGFMARDFASPVSRDYFSLGDAKHISDSSPSETMLPGHTLLSAIMFPQADRKKHRIQYRKSSDLPLQHSQEVEERILPPSEPARPGHTLLQPTKMMLKSAAKYPRTEGLSLVYGSQHNLGIAHGETPYRVIYSDFRKDNLAELLTSILKDPNSAVSSRRSSNSKRKLRQKKKTLKGKHKEKYKKPKKFKKLDSKRARIYRSGFDSSSEVRNIDSYAGSKGNMKYLKKKKKFEYHDSNTSGYSKDTKTRALQSSENFESYERKTNVDKKKTKPFGYGNNVNLHHKIGEKLHEKLDKKLKMSKLKKHVPLNTYKKTMSKMSKKKPPLAVRHSDRYEASSMESSSREARPKHSNNKASSEHSYSKEYKIRGYKKNKKKSKKVLKRSKKIAKRSKKKRMFRQGESDEETVEQQSQEKEHNDKESGIKKLKKDEKPKGGKTSGRLVYGSPDNYGIVWGKTPYRTMYTDFRRTTNLLGKILEAYQSYKSENKLKKAMVAIKVWPLEKTKVNPESLDKRHDQVLDNNSNEILDDVSIDIDVRVADYRKQRRKSGPLVKSAFRNRDENYDKGNSTNNCDGSDEAEESDDSDYEKNPGNPYTLFKNKYRQNWPWHFELGDHINLNPFGPEFNNQGGPSGPDLFFNRKWWYFNQDDYIPFR